jgi:hypothetical protein
VASGTAAAAVDADADVTITTTALTPSFAPSTRLRLYVDGDEGTPERGLCVEYQTSLQTPLVRRELEPAVTGMMVELLDATTNRWLPVSQAGGATPLAVRVTLSGGDAAGTDSLPAILTLPIVRAVGDPAAPTTPTQGLAR